MGKEAIARLIYRHHPNPDAKFLKHDVRDTTDRVNGDAPTSWPSAAKLLEGLLNAPKSDVYYFAAFDSISPDAQNRLLHLLDRPFNIQPPWILTSNEHPLIHHGKGDRLNPELVERLDTIHIHLPPLRNKQENIPQILSWYLNQFDNHSPERMPPMPDTRQMKRLITYHWPGNLHQLRQIARRAIHRDWDTAINTIETWSVQRTDIVDEMAAIYILSLADIRIRKERILEALIAAADLDDVGLLDLAILNEAICQYDDLFSFPDEKTQTKK